MVQERNSTPRKVQEPDLDRRTDPRPIPPVVNQNSGTPVTDIASGLALLLSIIAFFLGSYAAIQASSVRRQLEPVRPATQSNSSNQPESRPFAPLIAQTRFQEVKPGVFRQPTEDQTGEVELLSARRIERSGNLNFARIDMRIRRLDRSVQGLSEIDLPNTIALNSRTNERYTAIEARTPQDRFINMASLNPGSSINASVIVRVPENLDRIDLDIPNVRVFRNVPIS
ncbi:hypothetical protein ACQ4M3_15155 [Leptolyngbya sp. AN03gr2]|uniref:hypothetical protein n=1 Tax=unclassified Leptolyngbya TaxID=2650499 RepID=UPI003D31A564